MKLIYLLPAVYALTHYYPNVQELIQAKQVKFKEEFGPKPIKGVNTNSRPIPVGSIAIHGGNIEISSYNLAIGFYKLLPRNISRDSVYYTFGSNMTSAESLMMKTDNCKKRVCCEKIDGINVPGYKKQECKDKTIERKPHPDCQKSELCYESAAHITSSHFNNTNLINVVRNRFVVSWHGFSTREVGGKLIDVIIGGKFKNGLKIAEEFVRLAKPKNLIVFCEASGNCKTVTNNPISANVRGLEGVHDKNVANLGRCSAGLHIELSNSFRTDKKHGGHTELMQAIIKNLPQTNSDIPKSNLNC